MMALTLGHLLEGLPGPRIELHLEVQVYDSRRHGLVPDHKKDREEEGEV
jgi:hypothetical protein